MKKTLLLVPGILATGCTVLSGTTPQQAAPVPALVFVDGQISTSAAAVAHTQQNVSATVPSPPVTARSAPVSAPAPSTVPAVPSPAAPAADSTPAHGAGLTMSGTPGKAAIIHLPGVRNLTVEQWIRRILPDGWQLQYENALRQALNARVDTLWDNDEWPRILERLLVSRGLAGVLDHDSQSLTLHRPGVNAPATARNPFRDDAGKTAAVATTTVSSTTPAAEPPVPVPVKPSGPVWKAEPGSTLRTTLTQWAATAACSGGQWLVVWPVTVDYPVSAPLAFTGPFEQAMTELFTLYQRASVPLYAGVSRQQCVISVSDRPFSGDTP